MTQTTRANLDIQISNKPMIDLDRDPNYSLRQAPKCPGVDIDDNAFYRHEKKK